MGPPETVFGDFALLFKVPRGPHDYGRLFVQNAGRASHGLRAISEILVLPGAPFRSRCSVVASTRAERST